MSANEAWTARQEQSAETRREYERERLMLWTLDSIAELMANNGLTKADIARKLETSRSHLTQVFSGARNATLGTVSDLAWACGQRATVKFEPLRNGEFISAPVQLVRSGGPRVVALKEPKDKVSYLNAAYKNVVSGGS